ncbi:MAG: hypothetical protein MJ252_18790 [archaeon]|nr:hypothetical protein [archaeon]
MEDDKIDKTLDNLVDEKIEDAKKFLKDFYGFLIKKGQRQEIKNFSFTFSLSKKNENFRCAMCKRELNGIKYVCSHCGMIYCQKCFDINKFITKHPYTFYADTGFEDLKEIIEEKKKNKKEIPQGKNNFEKERKKKRKEEEEKRKRRKEEDWKKIIQGLDLIILMILEIILSMILEILLQQIMILMFIGEEILLVIIMKFIQE